MNRFARNIKGKVFRIDDTLNEPEVFREQVAEIILDENFTGVQPESVLLARSEQVVFRAARDEEQGVRLNGGVNREMRIGKRFVLVKGELFVKITGILFGDLLRILTPQRGLPVHLLG